MHYEIPTLDANAWKAISFLAEPGDTVRELNQRSVTLKEMLSQPAVMRKALRLMKADSDAYFAAQDAEEAQETAGSRTCADCQLEKLRAEVARLWTNTGALWDQIEMAMKAIFCGRHEEHPGLYDRFEDLQQEVQQLRAEIARLTTRKDTP